MTATKRVDPRTYALPAIGLATLALLGTSVPVARAPEASIVRPLLAPSTSAVSAGGGATTSIHTGPQVSTADLIVELRDTASFTWEQTSKLFGVSRRTVHLWAAGGNMTAQNEELLVNLIREVRAIRASEAPDERMHLLALLDRQRSIQASTEHDINRPADIFASDA